MGSLNVFEYGHGKFKRVRWFWKNLRCAWQRAKYGVCDYDWWNLDSWILRVIPRALRELAKNTRDYPLFGDTYGIYNKEDWQRTLRELADSFDYCHEKLYNHDDENEYFEALVEARKTHTETKEIIEQCNAREAELWKQYTDKLAGTFDKFVKLLPAMWD